jgi:HSF-type DNA-binding
VYVGPHITQWNFLHVLRHHTFEDNIRKRFRTIRLPFATRPSMTDLNKEPDYVTATSVTSVPQLLVDSSDNEEDELPAEPPGAPALPVDENGNTVYRYRDFSHVDENDAELDGDIPAATPTNRGNSESSIRVQKFPVKLYAILAQKEFHDIICWMPHGRSWKVLKPSMFESLVMPLFFEYSNYHSFNRLVNAWSFRRISSGPDRGSYYHEVGYHDCIKASSDPFLRFTHILLLSYYHFSYFFAANLTCRTTCVVYQRHTRSYR